MAAPMKATMQDPTRISFRAWKVSEATERMGDRTALEIEAEVRIQLALAPDLRSAAMKLN